MSPALDRNVVVDEEYFLSISSADLTLTGDHEGWLLYNSTSQRFKFWDGAAWKTFAHSPVTGADLGDGSVTDAKLRDSGALSVIGRSVNSSGDPADIAVAAGSGLVLRESGSTLGFGQVGSAGIADDSIGSLKLKTDAVSTIKIQDDAVTLAKLEGMGGGGPGVLAADVSGNPEWKGPTNYPAYLISKDSSSGVSWPKISGTSFPTSPVDGQKFTHTTHNCAYFYSSTAGGWLSESVYEFYFSATIDISVSVYMAMGMSGTTQFTDTLGPRFGFATKVVGMSLQMATSGTAAVDVWDDGSVVSGSSAQLSLSAQIGKDDDALMSTTIAAGSIIGVKRTSGTVEGACLGSVRLRRFET